MAATIPASSRNTAAIIQPASPAITPAEFTAAAASSTRPRTGRNPRKTGSHFALKPQTNGTRNPQVWSTRKRWSKPDGSSGDHPRNARNSAAPKLMMRVSSRPAVPAITRKTHSSSAFLPESSGRWPETQRKKIRKASNSNVAETGSRIRNHQEDPLLQRFLARVLGAVAGNAAKEDQKGEQ